MKLIDITHDTETTYRLKKNEQVAFFLFNREAELSFELAGTGATAHIFAFFIGSDTKRKLQITQKHVARKTTSTASIKSALSGDAELSYEGVVMIEKDASLADASQESRSLLLSPNARAFTRPALEILAHDVKCRHAATVSPLNEEMLFFAQARGLSREAAKKLLVRGFFQDTLNTISDLGGETEAIEKMLSKHLA